jgi:hypothetical protein
MPLEGRIEKRIPMTVQVYLVSLKEPRTAERVLTENVSPHGARVVTKRLWQPGEQQWISPLSGQFEFAAQVVYCQPIPDQGFCIGLDFREHSFNWQDELIGAA